MQLKKNGGNTFIAKAVHVQVFGDYILHKMLHSTKSWVVDQPPHRAIQSALLHWHPCDKTEQCHFISNFLKSRFFFQTLWCGVLNVYVREVHQIHETQLLELQVIFTYRKVWEPGELGCSIWVMALSISNSSTTVHGHPRAVGMAMRPLSRHRTDPADLQTALKLLHCIIFCSIITATKHRKGRRIKNKTWVLQSLVHCLQAGVLVGTCGTHAQPQQLSCNPLAFHHLWGTAATHTTATIQR